MLGKTGPATSARSSPSDYEAYLRTDELTSLQGDPRDYADPDEIIFIIVHQSSELWLKLLARELTIAEDALRDGTHQAVAAAMARARLCLREIISQLEALDAISPDTYQRVRSRLGQGSGFSSPGWNKVKALAQRIGEAFERRVLDEHVDLRASRTGRAPRGDAIEVADSLLAFDADVAAWRRRHLALIVRLIGDDAVGLAGTPIGTLAKLADTRLYPDLRRLRTSAEDMPSTPGALDAAWRGSVGRLPSVDG